MRITYSFLALLMFSLDSLGYVPLNVNLLYFGLYCIAVVETVILICYACTYRLYIPFSQRGPGWLNELGSWIT